MCVPRGARPAGRTHIHPLKVNIIMIESGYLCNTGAIGPDLIALESETRLGRLWRIVVISLTAMVPTSSQFGISQTRGEEDDDLHWERSGCFRALDLGKKWVLSCTGLKCTRTTLPLARRKSLCMGCSPIVGDDENVHCMTLIESYPSLESRGRMKASLSLDHPTQLFLLLDM